MNNSTQAANSGTVSRIAAGMSITNGEITSSHDIRFDGSFSGKISSVSRVVIGETAVLSGDIICENIDIYGKFDGTINAKDSVSLKNGCLVTGSISSANLVVELGSKLTGSVKCATDAEFIKICEDNPFLKQHYQHQSGQAPASPESVQKVEAKR